MINNSILKKSMLCIGYSAWSILGFNRGVNYYNYMNKRYDNNNNNNNNGLYIHKFISGSIGVILYACPIFLPITLYKELYRLEIDLRKLENEKKTHSYYSLI
jgi:hypothetical protein